MEQAFRRRLEEELRGLRQEGWEPVSPDQLSQLNLPEDTGADFVVRRGSKFLLGQIKSRNSRNLQNLERLAQLVSTVPNAEMELHWLGEEPEFYPDRELLREYVQDSRTLLASGQVRAAFLIAWSALEGALLHYAADSRAPLPDGEPLAPRQAWPLVSQLYSIGYITDGDYERFRQLYRQRNTVAHFTGDESLDPSGLEGVLDTISLILNQDYLQGSEKENAIAAVLSADPARRLAARRSRLFPAILMSFILERCIVLADGLAQPDHEPVVGDSRARSIARSIGRVPAFMRRGPRDLDRLQARVLVLALEIGQGRPTALAEALNIAHELATDIVSGEAPDAIGKLPAAMAHSISSSLRLAREFARDHTFRPSLNREIALMVDRSAELTSILSEAMSHELRIEPTEGIADALLNHALDDFTNADVTEVGMTDSDLPGIHWSEQTGWPAEIDMSDLRRRSTEDPPGSGTYVVSSLPDIQNRSDHVRVHAIYRKARIDAIYHPSTQLVDIVSGPVPHVSGLRPSRAAREVIQAVNETSGKMVTGSRNGWDFWVVTSTGQSLQSIRGNAGLPSS